jgi:hypothetical protein
MINNNRESYRLLNQVWEVGVFTFNGIEVCLRNLFNDINEVRKVVVNNQLIISRQNEMQVNFITKLDDRIQRSFQAVSLKITSGFDIDKNLMQIQIVTMLG